MQRTTMHRLPAVLLAGLILALGSAPALASTPGALRAQASSPPPPVYNYASPSPGGVAAASATSSLTFTKGSSAQTTVATGDSQAVLSLPAGAVSLPKGQKGVTVSIQPKAPALLAPFPAGMSLVGNAYTVSLTSRPAGRPVVLRSGRLTLRYPVPGTADAGKAHSAFVLTGGQWVATQTAGQDDAAAHEIGLAITQAGSYGVGLSSAPVKKKGKPFPWWIIVVVVVVLGLASAVWLRVKRARERRRRMKELRDQHLRRSRSQKRRR